MPQAALNLSVCAVRRLVGTAGPPVKLWPAVYSDPRRAVMCEVANNYTLSVHKWCIYMAPLSKAFYRVIRVSIVCNYNMK